MSPTPIEDIYPLSPMQQGMLFHSIGDPEADLYFERLSCTLQGDLDAAALQRAWQHSIERHAILRTAFSWEGREKPLQVVLRQLRLPWAYHDWRDRPADAQARDLAALLDADQAQGFQLARPPLIRLLLIRLTDDSYHFSWSFHHILMDGWSSVSVFREAFALYAGFRHGRDPALERPRPFREYLAWLQQQDMASAEAFWRQNLAGFTSPTPLPGADMPAAPGQPPQLGVHELVLAPAATARLQALVQPQQLTLNTLLQGAWALLLGRYADSAEVAFGTTVTGRPFDLAGVDAMVGLFINTLPLRIGIPPAQTLLPWLRQIQRHNLDLRQYEYTPLAQIQRWAEVPRGQALFESIFIFENVPNVAALLDPGGGLAVQDLVFVQRANYPINLLACVLDGALHLRAIYDAQRISAGALDQLLEHLGALLDAIAARPDGTLADLAAVIPPQRVRLLVAATFTAQPIVEPLEFWMDQLGIPARVALAPYSQVFQQLLDPQSLLASNSAGINILLLRPEDWVQQADSAHDFSQRLGQNVQEFLGALELASATLASPTLLCLCPASEAALADPASAAAIRRAEEQISGRAAALRGVSVLGAAALARSYALEQINDAFADAAGHIPYTPAFFAVLGAAIGRAIFARGSRIRALAFDCDELLWAGSCGEDGPEQIQITPAHAQVQGWLAQQAQAGVRLGLASQSDQADIRATFQAQPTMPLRPHDIAAWQAGWQPTPYKIRALAEQLRLDEGEVLYLSANPIACAEIREFCPSALSILLPADPDERPAFLEHLWVGQPDAPNAALSRAALAQDVEALEAAV